MAKNFAYPSCPPCDLFSAAVDVGVSHDFDIDQSCETLAQPVSDQRKQILVKNVQHMAKLYTTVGPSMPRSKVRTLSTDPDTVLVQEKILASTCKPTAEGMISSSKAPKRMWQEWSELFLEDEVLWYQVVVLGLSAQAILQGSHEQLGRVGEKMICQRWAPKSGHSNQGPNLEIRLLVELCKNLEREKELHSNRATKGLFQGLGGHHEVGKPFPAMRLFRIGSLTLGFLDGEVKGLLARSGGRATAQLQPAEAEVLP
ncbi:unnamed protein product [Taenia asiatica]|uniref:DUF5726 domain-containing protein n=1 Tax=Taenia asiatica TaxID=60517 RepID=A0A0R3VUU8_TAEAS|nr:unnamed protein product [Taenia asiatica]